LFKADTALKKLFNIVEFAKGLRVFDLCTDLLLCIAPWRGGCEARPSRWTRSHRGPRFFSHFPPDKRRFRRSRRAKITSSLKLVFANPAETNLVQMMLICWRQKHDWIDGDC